MVGDERGAEEDHRDVEERRGEGEGQNEGEECRLQNSQRCSTYRERACGAYHKSSCEILSWFTSLLLLARLQRCHSLSSRWKTAHAVHSLDKRDCRCQSKKCA